MTALDQADREFLDRAIRLSRQALEDEGKTPFGAILVLDGQLVGEGTSRVAELCDPTAHAEIMALRSAGAKLGRHLFENAVLYASSEPCPMCLAACYWARVPRVVFAATSRDVAASGFEDLQFYRELGTPTDMRAMREDAADAQLREIAVAVLKDWTRQLPGPVEPKY
jgi:guanine deaminase